MLQNIKLKSNIKVLRKEIRLKVTPHSDAHEAEGEWRFEKVSLKKKERERETRN
jgi:hypothetical protein